MVVVQDETWRGGGGADPGGMVPNFFRIFFYFEFKNTSNLTFPGFKMPSERFLFKNFETGITFCHIRFFNFQNLVRSCQPLGGTPCNNHFSSSFSLLFKVIIEAHIRWKGHKEINEIYQVICILLGDFVILFWVNFESF